MTMRRRLSHGLALALLAAVPLAGCSANPSEEGHHGSSSPSASASTPVTTVAASLVASTTPTKLTASQPRTVDVTVPQIPKARNLSQAIEVVRERTLRQASWDDATAVRMTSAYLASSDDVVGVQLTSTTTTGSTTTTTPVTLWYDATLSQTFNPTALISWPQWPMFSRAVASAAQQAGLDQAKASAALQMAPAPWGDGPAMAFDTAGGLVVTFPAGVFGPQPSAVTLGKDDVEPFLSDLGAKAQGASLHPSAFTGTPSHTARWWTPLKDRPEHPSSPNDKPLPGDSTAQTEGAGATVASGQDDASPSASSAPTTPRHPSTAVGIDCTQAKCVALTYDDGPADGTTTILSDLEKAHAAATFFELGTSIEEHPDTTRLVAVMGQEIGNHSSTHPDLARLGQERLTKEIEGNSTRLAKITGRKPMLMRPPYGSHNDAADKVIASQGMAVINWSVDTNDWKTRSTPETVKKVLTDVKIYTEPIILMHDIHDSTVAAAGQIIPTLTKEGYTLVTVSELTLNTGGLRTGHGYCRGTWLVQDGYLCKG